MVFGHFQPACLEDFCQLLQDLVVAPPVPTLSQSCFASPQSSLRVKGVCVVLCLDLENVSSVSVDVRPNLQQFFRGDSLSVSCADVQTDGWTVKRRLKNGKTQTCGNSERTFGEIVGSSCVSHVVADSSGVYWCETSSGQQSEQVSITVTEEWTISVDHLSDADQYSCYVPLVGESAQSSLRVKVSATNDHTTSSSDPGSSPDPDSSSGSTTPVIIAVVSLVVLVLILVLLLLLWKKHKGDSGSSPPADVTYADVTIAQAANRRDKHHGEAETVYAGIKTNTEGAEDVTYSHVVIKDQRSSGRNHAQSPDPDVVYSSVRPRNT
ncbi:uncharacterized protein LOC115438378 [Sphaeramia orbicularis]|uniref:uncharacterized protein LOC115438378 n=1 Tax=Sphaeramia orbicularis TaxID=375764 RepID=UPI00117E1399|nr:uncharacterized protein LOC115438378 [Sphaeramia orbicularis]